MKQKIAAVFAFAMIATPVLADGLTSGDAAAGKTRAVACGACHGADGNSVNAGSETLAAWPSIAGQGAPYLVAQLKAFQTSMRTPEPEKKLRPDAVMAAQTATLTDADIENVAAFYAEQTPAPHAVADADLVDLGEAIYRGGDKDGGTPACMACHGPTGAGNPAASYPALSGQWARYTAKQLHDYQGNARKSDGPTKVMRDIAKTMDDEQIAAVASYIQGLQ